MLYSTNLIVHGHVDVNRSLMDIEVVILFTWTQSHYPSLPHLLGSM